MARRHNRGAAGKVSNPDLNGMSDRASSLINNTGRRVTIYQGHKYSGHSFTTTARRRAMYTTLGQAHKARATRFPTGRKPASTGTTRSLP
ncbi:peptidase inhibitor family I36 protein [Streptomyces sp. NPDC049949]|uniref:peptidase inhibitor family I36 protein n=1 Tax=Streptomyces sp. NPDC049949 TaxID=3154627 RepID=UPI003429D565